MICPYCKIEVGGNLTKCPLCQSKLRGEPEEIYFPVNEEILKKSVLYKIQIFIVITAIIVGVGLDFFFGLRIGPFKELHWSLLLAMWLIVMEIEVMRHLVRGSGASRKLTLPVFTVLILMIITSYYFDIMWLTVKWIVPLTLVATLIANFVIGMIDKHGNAMIYLLTNMFVGIIPGVVLLISHRDIYFTWTICLLVSSILFVAAVIFKGREVLKEVQRRLNV
ncbi:MAG: hypothetical protein K6F92_06080 [Lachnospiraceae bacterium]|nr:hypothetical protein [Lachnospiraceae bacterium]